MNTLPTHPALRHPHTGEPLRAVGVLNGRPIWPVIGAAEDDNNSGGTGNAGGAGGTGQGSSGAAGGAGGSGGAGEGANTGDKPDAGTDRGYPDNTPIERMTDAQQAAYWKFHARKHERAAGQAPNAQELADLRDKATKYDEHQRAQMSDLEREQAKAAELQKKVDKFERGDLRRAAAKNAGLTADDAEFITGKTPEEMAASAVRLKERLGSAGTATRASSHDQGARGRSGANQSKSEAGMAEARKRGFVKTAAQTTQT